MRSDGGGQWLLVQCRTADVSGSQASGNMPTDCATSRLDVHSHVADGLHADAAALVAAMVSSPLAATGGDGRD